MCGRYATTRTSADLSALFEALDETGRGPDPGGGSDPGGGPGPAGPLAPSWNVAPTDPVPVVRVRSAGHRALVVARWGLVPAWADSPKVGARMINARAETVATARAFARAFAGRRCLVPADGWYEWRVDADGVKRAYYLTPRDGGVLALAGLWSVWRGTAGDPLLTCAVVTTAAQGELAGVHDRMPLLLAPPRWEAWLRAAPEPDRLLAPPDAATLAAVEIRPVGPKVGNVRNNGPELIEPVVPDVNTTAAVTPVDLTLF